MRQQLADGKLDSAGPEEGDVFKLVATAYIPKLYDIFCFFLPEGGR
jgi:hypothetical protein